MSAAYYQVPYMKRTMTNNNIKNNKTKTVATTVISAIMIGLVLMSPTTVLPNAVAETQKHTVVSSFHAVNMKTQKEHLLKGKVQPNTIVDTINVYNDDCTQYATESSPCEEYAPGWSSQFFYSAPFSYVDAGSDCGGTECYDQDLEVVYPSQITYQGNTYSFSGADQNQCLISDSSDCSTSNEWTSPSTSKVVDYYNTPAGGISILTVIDYTYGGNIVEYDYWYNLDYGYNL